LANWESESLSGGSGGRDIGSFSADSGMATATSISLWSEQALLLSSK
jgi:hypothetical protein